MARVKKEAGSRSNNTNTRVRELRSSKIEANSTSNEQQQQHVDEVEQEDEVVVRRNLRSRYLAVKNLLSGDTHDLSQPDSQRFKSIIDEVESLHAKVEKPREQVADAEALMDITSSFLKSVKAQKNEGVTPSDFVSCLFRDFGRQGRATSSVDNSSDLVLWKDIGLAVSHIFRKGTGCCTMLGPMSSELKRRKSIVRKKHVKPTDTSRPEELNNLKEEKTDTDKNMSIMFGILRKNRRVRLENLVLNRKSFAQTVENLFAFSFLVKDGRAEITANENGHFVCPRNAPAAEAVASGRVSYSHFVFRFDYKDWKLMLDSVVEGEELMPHRVPADTFADSEFPAESANADPERVATTTPIRKLSRNRGLVLQEQTVVEDSPESDENRSRAAYIRKGKRKII
ncbi:hypothetical protein BVRB_3g060320 [Beta vulgaris subsp. vulgaris]|uniref:non-structural maintenance of chromosomes element 4 homolog A n=1 Tax=Beta vulgaris subsp. vulgaris TaxID=3555 RepID=UPI00053F5571|nr:non-structural maintenance of chromosomes element 4 homolog A [Beta vulgaris subsp. vulgaris]KMT15326.1 hypothetical protein BVRB_3g060320 [Beta vulgaris subsp. vulgaris]